jgi:hypothetical protein
MAAHRDDLLFLCSNGVMILGRGCEPAAWADATPTLAAGGVH